MALQVDGSELIRGRGVPRPAPLEMPRQNLRHSPEAGRPGGTNARTTLPRTFTFGGALVLASFGTYEIVRVVDLGGLNMVEVLFCFLFVINFAWIGFSALSAVCGLFWRPGAPVQAAPAPVAAVPTGTEGERKPIALVMPVYNEDPVQTGAALEAMAEELQAAGTAGTFEIFVISDTTDADIWIKESLLFSRLAQRLDGVMPLWYRRRWRNTARKAGNVEDFVTNWGARYEFFIVLDADSLLSAATINSMAAEIRADPDLGLLQTAPALAGGMTLFARLQQFAGAVYGPTVARGIACWAGNDGNYWGHNAIIRTVAFAESAGLPELKGRRPVGGHILSHDFVEAALMRRAGWSVRMNPELGGSWEDSPPSLIDVAVRDRRWAQGNLQHVGVIGARGLSWPSRVHFAIGIMGYLSSPFWMMLIIAGMVLTLQAHFFRPEYFTAEYQFFPSWPRFDSERMLRVFLLTMGILFLPKIIGMLRTLANSAKRRALGGGFRIFLGVLLETLLSAVYAPILMIIQSRQIYEIISGRDSGWSTQRRGGSGDDWATVWNWHHWHLGWGVVITAAAYAIDVHILAWLSPVVAGLLLAPVLSWLSGNPATGRLSRRTGLLCTQEERQLPALIRRRDELAEILGPLPGDGLRHLAQVPEDADIHIQWNMPPPELERGKPDAEALTAEAKLSQADTLDEALSWLTKNERVRAAASRPLLHRLWEIASQTRREKPGVIPQGLQ